MKLNLAALVRLMFPYSPDEETISRCTPALFRLKYFLCTAPEGYALASFKDPQIRSAIHLVKFHHNGHAAALLSSLLAAHLETLPYDKAIIIPMPLSKARLRMRGHNQAATIAARACASLPQFALRTDLLDRVLHTPSQTTLSRAQRLKNLSHAFEVPQKCKEELRGANLILFDDVITTGATMRAAKQALYACGPASMQCISLAH